MDYDAREVLCDNHLSQQFNNSKCVILYHEKINCCKPLLIAVEEKKWPGSDTIISLFQVFICTYYDFSITLALYKVHRTDI